MKQFQTTASGQLGIDRLTGIQAFARVASLGSFTAAARSLSISPAAVSKSIQRLEKQFGLTLLDRGTRSVTLTEEGRSLHSVAVRLLAEASGIEEAASAARAEPSGRIRIAALPGIGIHIIAPELPRFRKLHPKVSVDLRLKDAPLDMVEEGVDVTVGVGRPADSGLMLRDLGTHGLCVFASPSYLARHGRPSHPDDLSDHECVNFRHQLSGRPSHWPFHIDCRDGDVMPSAATVIDVGDALAAYLAAGGEIGISPTYVASPYVERGELIPVLLDFMAAPRRIVALWPPSRRGNPAVKAFLQFVFDLFQAPTPWDAMVGFQPYAECEP